MALLTRSRASKNAATMEVREAEVADRQTAEAVKLSAPSFFFKCRSRTAATARPASIIGAATR